MGLASAGGLQLSRCRYKLKMTLGRMSWNATVRSPRHAIGYGVAEKTASPGPVAALVSWCGQATMADAARAGSQPAIPDSIGTYGAAVTGR